MNAITMTEKTAPMNANGNSTICHAGVVENMSHSVRNSEFYHSVVLQYHMPVIAFSKLLLWMFLFKGSKKKSDSLALGQVKSAYFHRLLL